MRLQSDGKRVGRWSGVVSCPSRLRVRRFEAGYLIDVD